MISIDKELCINCGRCVESCPMGIFCKNREGIVEVGREKRCLRCMHCSAACPRKAVEFEGISRAELYPVPAEDEVFHLIQARRSIRHFKPEPPARELIQSALDGAAFAPSAKNQRLVRWTVLYGKERTDAAAKLALDWAVETKADPALVAMARSGLNLVTCGAPCVLVCHAPREAHAVLDGAIAMTTLELLLSREGMGTCWAGYFARISEKAQSLREWLGLPEGDEVLCALMAGYPDGDSYPNLPLRVAAETNWVG